MKVLKKGARAKPEQKMCLSCYSEIEIGPEEWIRQDKNTFALGKSTPDYVLCPVCNHRIVR